MVSMSDGAGSPCSMNCVCMGLLAAWALHDAEELVTMSPASARTLRRLPRAVPMTEGLRERGVSQEHVTLSIGIMAVIVTAVSRRGIRSGGASPLFRGAVLAFGVHGLLHMAGAAALRGYATGVATSPTIVLPYWIWARRGLSDIDRSAVLAALSVVPLLSVVHGAALAVLGERSVRGWRQAGA
ncbi:HXXEE domain-containing protein [Actinomyces slackii]|uniref:HXXEE domain-containing protein n=1 Tax=Actinomyces slackii TaxID=52774 RepID=A0A448KFX4_9ACTO|nr:HXXEE domain-containing protein [Actinomyces slackii]VEG75819.1 Uncharacterised protein [Actinomyces slackii]